MNKKLIEKINTEIKEKNLQPTSRWFFRIKNLSLWVPGVLSIIVGALAVSSILFGVTHTGWQYAPYLKKDALALIVRSLPYIWIILAVVFSWITVTSLRFTKHGYRYKAATLILGSLVVSIALGGIAYAAGVGKYLDTELGRTVPQFESVIDRQQTLWHDPSSGRLGGMVQSISDNEIMLQDRTGLLWTVVLDEVVDKDRVLLDTLLDRQRQVRVLGYAGDEPEVFYGCFVVPFLAPNSGGELRLPPHVFDADISSGCRTVLEKEM